MGKENFAKIVVISFLLLPFLVTRLYLVFESVVLKSPNFLFQLARHLFPILKTSAIFLKKPILKFCTSTFEFLKLGYIYGKMLFVWFKHWQIYLFNEVSIKAFSHLLSKLLEFYSKLRPLIKCTYELLRNVILFLRDLLPKFYYLFFDGMKLIICQCKRIYKTLKPFLNYIFNVFEKFYSQNKIFGYYAFQLLKKVANYVCTISSSVLSFLYSNIFIPCINKFKFYLRMF